MEAKLSYEDQASRHYTTLEPEQCLFWVIVHLVSSSSMLALYVSLECFLLWILHDASTQCFIHFLLLNWDDSLVELTQLLNISNFPLYLRSIHLESLALWYFLSIFLTCIASLKEISWQHLLLTCNCHGYKEHSWGNPHSIHTWHINNIPVLVFL